MLMRSAILFASIVVVTGWASSGCLGGADGSGKKAAADLKVGDMAPTMAIKSALEIGGSHVEVDLLDNDGAVYTMKDGESLTVKAGDASDQKLGAVNGHYAGDIEVKDAGTPVIISFTSKNGDSAPDSEVTMTEQLGMTSPPFDGSLSVSRASDAISLAWNSDPSEDPLTVSWTGSCIEDGQLDDGVVRHNDTAATIPAGSLVHRDNADDTCDVTVTVTRTRTGAIDSHFGGGAITHSFSTSAHVTSNP
jgi:hypothetical protein